MRSGDTSRTHLHVALIQNPGWNKTETLSCIQDALGQFCKEVRTNFLVDSLFEKALHTRLKKVKRVVGIYPELKDFLQQLGGSNTLKEARFLNMYDCKSWLRSTNEDEKEVTEGDDMEALLEQTFLSVAGGIQPEVWYSMKWRSAQSGLFQRFKDTPILNTIS